MRMIFSRLHHHRHLWKLFHSSTMVSIRQQPKSFRSKERPTLSDEDDYFGDISQANASRKYLKKQNKEFSMNKFTDAVRGDLPAVEEQELFKNRKPKWMGSTTVLDGNKDTENHAIDDKKSDEDSDSAEVSLKKAGSRSKVGKPQPQRSQYEYEFLDDKSQFLRNTIIGVKNRSNRMKSRKILLEGHRLINEALINGVKLDTIFFTRAKILDDLDQEMTKLMRPKIYEISTRQMALWSEMTTPPGVIAIAKMPSPEVMDVGNQMPLTVVCDNIRDPSNLGAIIRVLAGASCRQIILVKGCVDPWDTKVLRTAMGAHFHIPIHYNVPWELVINYLDNPAQMFLAENLEPPGIDPAAVRDNSKWPRLYPKNNRHPLVTSAYYDIDFTKAKSIVLVLGGEAEGVGDKAYEMTAERQGIRITIPLGNQIESLNAASAVAVIAFEMRRQLARTNASDNSFSVEEEEDPPDSLKQ